jgi:hypothetical protein
MEMFTLSAQTRIRRDHWKFKLEVEIASMDKNTCEAKAKR